MGPDAQPGKNGVAEAVALPPIVLPLPAHVATALIKIALRTEPGQAYWAGYAAALVEGYPWLSAPVQLLPGPGTILPGPPNGGS